MKILSFSVHSLNYVCLVLLNVWPTVMRVFHCFEMKTMHKFQMCAYCKTECATATHHMTQAKNHWNEKIYSTMVSVDCMLCLGTIIIVIKTTWKSDGMNECSNCNIWLRGFLQSFWIAHSDISTIICVCVCVCGEGIISNERVNANAHRKNK